MFGGFTHIPAVELAERLAAFAPPGLDRVFFADSGSISVEVAAKISGNGAKNIGLLLYTVLKQEQKTLLTEDAKEADSVQDSDLTALKGIARAMLNIPDAEKLQSARKLSSSEYTLNSALGYVSLNSTLQTDDVLAVAFEYTYGGVT